MSAPCCPFAAAATWITAVLGIAGIVLAVWLSSSNSASKPAQETAKPPVVSEK